VGAGNAACGACWRELVGAGNAAFGMLADACGACSDVFLEALGGLRRACGGLGSLHGGLGLSFSPHPLGGRSPERICAPRSLVLCLLSAALE